MTTRASWLNMAYPQNCADLSAYGHAMLASRVRLCTGTGKLNGPIFSVAQGLIVPISWGSPPIT